MPGKQITKILFVVLIAAVLYSALVQPLTAFAQTKAEVQTVKIESKQEAGTSCGFLQIWCYLSHFFNWVSIQIGLGISYIGALLITIAAAFIQVLVEVSRTIISNQMILTGFKITLSVANLGFVLAIVVIAFSTILRFQTYGAKQLLWKLIVAAVLVNFSLTIVGVLIDFANVIGMSFVEASSSGNINSFAANLANSLNIQGNVTNVTTGTGFGNIFEDYFKMLASITLTAIFNLLLVVVFFALAFMMLIRNIYLMILVILMPIVWLLWIFPNLSGHWSKWWNSFIRWTFFFPAMMFFVYVSIFASNQITTSITKLATPMAEVTAASDLAGEGGVSKVGGNDFIASILATFAKMGILIGGLIAANSLGINGASAALGIAKGVKNYAIGKAGKIGKAAGKAAAAPAKGAAAAMGAGIVKSKLWNKVAGTAAKIPGLKGMAAGMYNMAEVPKETIEESQKQFSKDNNDAFLVKSGTFTINPIEKAARANEIVKRGLTEKYIAAHGQDKFDNLLSAAKTTGATKEILASRADLAPRLIDAPTPAEAIKQVAGKLSAEGILKQAPEVFKNTDFISAMDSRHYSEVFQKASKEQRDNFAVGLEKIPKESAQKIARNLSVSAILNLPNEVFKNTNFVNALDTRHVTDAFQKGSINQLTNLAVGLEKIREQDPNDDRVQMAIQNPIMQSVIKKSLEDIKKSLNKEFVGLFDDVVKKEIQEKAVATKVAEEIAAKAEKERREAIRKTGTFTERIQLEKLEEKERKERA